MILLYDFSMIPLVVGTGQDRNPNKQPTPHVTKPGHSLRQEMCDACRRQEMGDRAVGAETAQADAPGTLGRLL